MAVTPFIYHLFDVFYLLPWRDKMVRYRERVLFVDVEKLKIALNLYMVYR